MKGIEWLRLDASVDFGWKPRFLINYKCYFDSKLKYYKGKNNEILQVGYCKLDIASQVVEIVVFYQYFETVLLSILCYIDQLYMWCSDLSSNIGILFSV